MGEWLAIFVSMSDLEFNLEYTIRDHMIWDDFEQNFVDGVGVNIMAER